MQGTTRKHSYFELLIIAALSFTANLPAMTLSLAGLIPLFHSAFMLCGYLLVRLLVGRFSPWVGKLLFSASVVLLVASIAIMAATGMQVNLFVASLLLQPGIADEIGVPGWLLYAGIILFITLALLAAKRFQEPAFEMKGRMLLTGTIALGTTAQTLYGVLFFNGQAQVEETRRQMPFFAAPHPYHIRRITSLVLGAPHENPFAISKDTTSRFYDPTPLELAPSAPNILLIIADSLRGKELHETPELAPNLLNWGNQGFSNMHHYSVSNCTHFGLFTLYTGLLSTKFGEARRDTQTYGLLPLLKSSGYTISSAESTTLNWYNTAQIIFPEGTDRFIASTDEGTPEDDAAVTRNTLEKLKNYKERNQPFFHTSYYTGTHYPYDGVERLEGETNIDQYKRTIQAFDQEVGQILNWLQAQELTKNTIVIITSDHGEQFAERPVPGHADKLSDVQVQVPFILTLPSSLSQDKQLPIRSHTDIVPTLTAILEGRSMPASAPLVLANCSYDFPSGFALIDGDKRIDFSYSDGYLVPANDPNSITPVTRQDQLEAAEKLIPIIKKGRL